MARTKWDDARRNDRVPKKNSYERAEVALAGAQGVRACPVDPEDQLEPAATKGVSAWR